nr:MAG TPA: Protein of unknown function (DUF1043) [Caudoviricetes sp.]
MSDAVITALITTAGSIAVAFLTAFYGTKRPDHNEEDLKRAIEDLKKQNDELRKQDEKHE